MSGRRLRALSLLTGVALCALAARGASAVCVAGDCGEDERCESAPGCGEPTCVPRFTLPLFPIAPSGEPPLDAYTARITAVLDHAGSRFYTNCCETEIVAFTGERGLRSAGASGCPLEPGECGGVFGPQCICSYRQPSGDAFVVNGSYTGILGASAFLAYDGHAGYDYSHPSGTPIVAPREGQLCKALFDNINSSFFIAWERFHTFYIDHGVFGSSGWATWFLHAEDLAGLDAKGTALGDLGVGECAPVSRGQLVATVGNVGTFLPHLHFEVRRYPAEEGPESALVESVDPYGWQGLGPDPIDENPQARSQPAALWKGCGNHRVECSEACDDGNRIAEDGCSPACLLEEVVSEPGSAARGLGAVAVLHWLALRAHRAARLRRSPRARYAATR